MVEVSEKLNLIVAVVEQKELAGFAVWQIFVVVEGQIAEIVEV